MIQYSRDDGAEDYPCDYVFQLLHIQVPDHLRRPFGRRDIFYERAFRCSLRFDLWPAGSQYTSLERIFIEYHAGILTPQEHVTFDSHNCIIKESVLIEYRFRDVSIKNHIGAAWSVVTIPVVNVSWTERYP